jgi:hypothetical protein
MINVHTVLSGGLLTFPVRGNSIPDGAHDWDLTVPLPAHHVNIQIALSTYMYGFPPRYHNLADVHPHSRSRIYRRTRTRR